MKKERTPKIFLKKWERKGIEIKKKAKENKKKAHKKHKR